MEELTPLEEMHKELGRRLKLLLLNKPETCTKPLSVRLTETENNILNNMCDIFRLNRCAVIKLCIRCSAELIVDYEDTRKLNEIVGSE